MPFWSSLHGLKAPLRLCFPVSSIFVALGGSCLQQPSVLFSFPDVGILYQSETSN